MKRSSRGFAAARTRATTPAPPRSRDGFSWEDAICSTVLTRLGQRRDVLIRGGPREGVKALIRRIALERTAAGTVVIFSRNVDDWVDLCAESGYKIIVNYPPTSASYGKVYPTVICDDGVTEFALWQASATPILAISVTETMGVQVTNLRKESKPAGGGDNYYEAVTLRLD